MSFNAPTESWAEMLDNDDEETLKRESLLLAESSRDGINWMMKQALKVADGPSSFSGAGAKRRCVDEGVIWGGGCSFLSWLLLCWAR